MRNENFLLSFDFLSCKANLKVLGKERYRTKFGSIMSYLSIFAILGFSFYFIIQTLNRSNLILVYGQDSFVFPILNLTNQPLVVTLSNLYNQYYENQETYFKFEMSFFEYNTIKDESGNRQTVTKVTPVPLEPCLIDKHFGEYRKYFENVSMNNRFCLVPGKVNITTYGIYGDVTRGNSFLDVSLYKCQNTSTFNRCKSPEEINQQLSLAYMSIYYMDFSINPKDFENPIIPFMQSEVLQCGSKLFNAFQSSRTSINIETDRGFVFEDVNSQETYSFGQTERIVDLPSDNRITRYYITNSKKTELYRRSYSKFQTLLANVGGIINAIMKMSITIVEFVSVLELNDFLILNLFNYDQSSWSLKHKSSRSILKSQGVSNQIYIIQKKLKM
jgi:hypothetical protein